MTKDKLKGNREAKKPKSEAAKGTVSAYKQAQNSAGSTPTSFAKKSGSKAKF